MAQAPDSGKYVFSEIPLELDVFTFSDSTGGQIAKTNGLNKQPGIDEVMETMPQLSVVKKGAYAFVPSINAFHSNRLTVTIDGMRIFGACTDKMDPVTSYVETANLKSMDVNCHAGGASNGTSTGGNLNLALNDAKLGSESKVYGEARLGYQSVSNGINFNSGVGYRGEKFGIRAGFSQRKHDSYYAGGDVYIPYSQFNKNNYSISSKLKINQNTLIDAQYILDDAWDVGYPSLPMDVSKARAQIYSLTLSQYNLAKGIAKLKWKLYGNNVSHVMDDTKRAQEDVPIHMDMPGWSDTYGTYVTLENSSTSRHHYLVKLDYFQNFRKADMIMYPQGEAPMFMLTWPEIMNRNIGAYASDKWKINDNNTFEINGRTEWVTQEMLSLFGQKQISVFNKKGDSTYTFLPFEVGLNHNLKWTKSLTIAGGVSYGARAPGTSEMFGFYLFNKEDGYDYIGDPYLKMEKAFKSNINVDFLQSKWDMRVELFAYSIEDYIYGQFAANIPPMTVGARGSKEYVNLERVYHYGASTTFTYRLLENWGLESQWKMAHAQQENGLYLPQIPPVSYRNKLTFEKMFWYADAQVVGAFAQTKIDPTWGEDKTPSWAILNFNFGRKVKLNKKLDLNLSAAIENVFDQYYWAHLDWGNIPRYGRNFSFNMGLVF